MIILMGLAGTGKSTQGRLLAARLGCHWISTGNLLRAHTDPATQSQLLQGKMIDDWQTIKILEREFARVDAAHRETILDGSPRTMAQAEWLANQVAAGKIRVTAILHLIASPEIARQRLLARHRPDDHDPAIGERFKEYEQAIMPILDYLKQKGYTIHQINAEQPPEDVQADIVKALQQGGRA